MKISAQQAEESLAAVTEAQRRTRRGIAAREGANVLMMWGALWATAYVLTQLSLDRPERIGGIWTVLCGGGAVATGLVYWVQFRRGEPVREAPEKRIGMRVFAFWAFLFLFAFLWLAMLRPVNGIQMNAFMVTVIMFAYVVSGLWTDGAYMVWVGLGVTAATVIGYFIIPPAWYSVWMAVTGAGPMFGTGLYMRLRWN